MTNAPWSEPGYRVKADDIKYPNRLSDDQIAAIPIELIFEWIKIGAWKQKDFKRWLKVLRVIE